MRTIDADALIPMMKYATTDSEIGVFPIKIGFNDIEKVINEQPTVNTAETDLISRQAVIEINQSYHGQMPNEVNHRIWKEINELPSAQPEIIRCKDCKHWDGVDTCDVIDAPVWDNDFCSMAERRGDDKTNKSSSC